MQQEAWHLGASQKGWWLWRTSIVNAHGVIRWWGPRARSIEGSRILAAADMRRVVQRNVT
jgi:hypothetical protein